MKAREKSEIRLDSFHGDIEFLANNGRIHQLGMLSKICSVLNITGIFSGELKNANEKGFAYDSIRAKGNIQNGKLTLKETVIEGSSMQIICAGEVDFVEETVDLKVFLSPLKTLDVIVKFIPVVNDIFDGTLISIPAHVKGPWDDPTVIPLSPSAVGTGLLDILRATLKAPFKLIQPVLPKEGRSSPNGVQ
jgi:uncharacterized protein YhdP